ncbi:MAG: hypothetical protein QNJ54_26655 [Prochloraceae cyanobacterium]|nr:hypothetical protein [Prochloraceae cyanobacterium]
MTTIIVGLNVDITGGPQVNVPQVAIDVEAYDKIENKLSKGETKIAVQPENNEASFLLIKSSDYDPSGKLTYKPRGFEASPPPIHLDKPQIYLGAGAISSLLKDVTIITFTNNLDKEVSIEILVGRDGNPPTS